MNRRLAYAGLFKSIARSTCLGVNSPSSFRTPSPLFGLAANNGLAQRHQYAESVSRPMNDNASSISRD